MSKDRLNVIGTQNAPSNPPLESPRPGSLRLEAQAKFERLWMVDPEQFNPLRNCKERERLARSWDLMKEFADPSGKLAADLGCGSGIFSRKLTEGGAGVHAVDIAHQALQRVQEMGLSGIKTFQEYVPRTSLKDEAYDIVVATEIIAYLPHTEQRLLMSELCRLVKRKGIVICSAPIDINSIDALQRFGELAETEFKIEKWTFSYHRLWIRILDFFQAPRRFAKAAQDAEYRERELSMRQALSHWWFKWNSKKPFSLVWSLMQYLTNPLADFLKQQRSLLLGLEKICRFFWTDTGISHALFVGTRRPLIVVKPEEIPQERKHKREVWE